MISTNEVKIASVVKIPIKGASNASFITFEGLADSKEHFAIKLGEASDDKIPLIRIHSECITGDVFQSYRCDCGMQLDEAIKKISKHGGYILYLRQEGRGIGFFDKMKAYKLQDEGLDTYQANMALGHPLDGRSYDVAIQMLLALNINKVDLLTNNPLKIESLKNAGIQISSEVSTKVFVRNENKRYLEAKCKIGGHSINSFSG